MSGNLRLGRDKFNQVLDANRAMLQVADDLVSLADERPDLQGRLLEAINRLVKSGTKVNDAMMSAVRNPDP